MKIIVKILIVLSFVLITGCGSKELIDYKEISGVNHIIENKNNIKSVLVVKTTIGSHDCFNVDINEAYNSISNMKILKESNMSVTDNYMSYIFYFNDNTKTIFSFEGPYLYMNNKYYEIDITGINLAEEDLVECNY